MFGRERLRLELELPIRQRVSFKHLPFEKSPLEMFVRVQQPFNHAYILESVTGPRKLAEYSFIGFDPKLLITAKDETFEVRSEGGEMLLRKRVEDPLSGVRDIMQTCSSSSDRFRLMGGAVGYLSYDCVRRWEKIPDLCAKDSSFPDLEMGVFLDGIVYDYREREAFYDHMGEDRFDEVVALLEEEPELGSVDHSEPKANTSKEAFEKAVLQAKEYIEAGDIFQVVLSRRYDFTLKGELLSLYSSLREINPSPYMYYLKMGRRSIVGSSPEMLVRVEKGVVETFPIAGTRPNTEDRQQNRRLAEELLKDPKERAEHVMLVDLARNDIGRVCRFGSVKVPEFMQVHQYSHVQHMVSHVRGHLRSEFDVYDVLRAVFPAGTVSGAPKVRAMGIIEELEKERRGPYAGAVGYFSSNRSMDFAITIRTLVSDGERASIQVGAGIVADSQPEREWMETEHKARALMKALETVEGCRE